MYFRELFQAPLQHLFGRLHKSQILSVNSCHVLCIILAHDFEFTFRSGAVFEAPGWMGIARRVSARCCLRQLMAHSLSLDQLSLK